MLARIRELSDVPVVLVTGAEGGGLDRVRGLRAGADDCVTKPVADPEMLGWPGSKPCCGDRAGTQVAGGIG